MKKKSLFLSFCIGMFLSLGVISTTAQTGGFANVSQPSTSVTVYSASAFLSAIQQGNRTVYLSGSISLSGMNDVASNTAIIGLGTSARITGGGLDIDGVSNVIVKNIEFANWSDDAINVQDGSTNIWITHCNFTNGYDGCVDIKRGSDYVTVSWNHFWSHGKTCLLGHSDSNASQDAGHLRVTYHHNYFDGTDTRHPRVRFSALCHVYNNYYKNNEYGVASTCDAEVLVEGCYFENVDDPTLVGYGSSWDGDLVQRNNVFNSSGSPETSGSVPNPSYSYSLQDAYSAKYDVISGAGVNGDDGGGSSSSSSSGGSYYNITSRLSGKCVDVEGKSTSDNANVIQWSCNGGTNQQWSLEDAGSGYLYIKVRHSGKCMRAVNGNIVQYTCNTGWWSEMFSREDVGSGYYLIKNRSTGTCLRVENSSSSDGASIVLSSCNSSYYSQMFSFSSLNSGEIISKDEFIENDNKISIYPNPAIGDKITLKTNLTAESEVKISIYTLLGHLISNENIGLHGSGELVHNMDVKSLSQGIYIIQMEANNNIEKILFKKQ